MDIDTHYTTNKDKTILFTLYPTTKKGKQIYMITDRVKSQSSEWASLELEARKQSIFKGEISSSPHLS